MKGKGWQTLRLDELEPVRAAGVNWKPLRRTLGVSAFGTNAYVAGPGEDVVEEHSEERLGHEEVYVVVSGRATFTLDGEAHDAPAGTIVHLADPLVRRHARAEEPDTMVLAIGGKPGEAYTPSAWEWYFEAERFRKPFDPKAALELMAEAKARFPEHLGVSLDRVLGGARRPRGRRVGDTPARDRDRPADARVGARRRRPRLDPRPAPRGAAAQ